ncbi:hypothetical protein RDABS01_010429 [Bienertia sinuspersici]
MDEPTAKREKLNYARVLVEVQIEQPFPDQIKFYNERGNLEAAIINYEWLPITCSKCKKIGNHETICYANKGKEKPTKVWRRKEHDQKETQAFGQVQSGEQKEVGMLDMTEQYIHGVVKPSSGLTEFFYTFIYALNESERREELWRDLTNLSSRINGPWLIMGDINCVMNTDERIGSNVRSQEMLPGRICFEHCGLKDIQYGGNFFTWCNKQEGEDKVYSMLDRVVANDEWLESYNSTNAIFMPEGISDHSPALIRVDNGRSGIAMYCITRKLRKVKEELTELNRTGFCSVQAEAPRAYQGLIEAKQQTCENPTDKDLAKVEKEAYQAYKLKQEIYSQFLKQKTKDHWLKEGDSNIKLFHKSIQKRRVQNNVYAIKNMEGELKDTPATVTEDF